MKNLFLLLLGMIVLGGLSGCAGVSKPPKYALEGYSSRPDWSAAHNVVEAAGIDNLDDTRVDKDVLKHNGLGQKGSALGATVFSSAAYLSNLNHLGFATLPLSFISWSYINQDHSLRVGRKLYGWIPAELANTPEEAVAVQVKAIRTAVDQAIIKVAWPLPYRLDPERIKFAVDQKTSTSALLSCYYRYIVGGVCEKGCRMGFLNLSRSIEGTTRPVLGVAPDFLGGEKAWAFTRCTTFMTAFPFEKNPDYKVKYLFPFLLEVTKHLPEWNYLYVHDFSVDGKHTFPVVMHQGKVMLFVVPK